MWGRLEFDGAAITAVEVTADLTRLESDDSRRDRPLRRQAIETNEFPTASFVLTVPIAIARAARRWVSVRQHGGG